MRDKAIAGMLCVQFAVANIHRLVGRTVQFDEGVEYRVLQGIGKRRIGAPDLVNVLRNCRRFFQVQRTEVKHVPIWRKLTEIISEVILETIVKSYIVFKDEHG